MAVTRERLTAEQYLALPLDRHTQLIDGKIIVNAPRARHQRACANLYAALRGWARAAHGRGEAWLPLDVGLDDRNVYAPDVLWLDADHPVDLDATHLTRAPQLAVEVRSPSTWRFDIGRKREIYEAAGLGELWLVDTASETVLVYRRSSPAAGFDIALELARGEVLASRQLPGFVLAVSDVFA